MLLHGDSAQVLKTLKAESVDLVVTSPPYDNLRTYNGYTFDFEGIANELMRVLKPGGVIVWVVADATINGSESGTSFRQALYFKEIGLNLHDTMIYQKSNPMPNKSNRCQQSFEYMFVLSKGKPKSFNPIMIPSLNAGRPNGKGGFWKTKGNYLRVDREAIKETKMKANIWSYAVGSQASGAQHAHPAKFPLQLAVDHITSWSNPGDTVLDPFLGSGTTAEAAQQLGRKFIGIEISEEYLAIASKRIGAA